MTYPTNSSENVEAFKEEIEFTITNAKSPHEELESLTNAGIEWHVTREGTLWYKIWQIGAEDFATPEQVAIIQETQQPPEQSDELDWLSSNLNSIRQDYAGQWIAIYENRIVGSAEDLPGLLTQIAQIDKPFITFIPSGQIVWNFTYAN